MLPYSFNQRMLKVGHNEPIKWLRIINSCDPNWSQSHHFTYRYLKDKLEPVESRKACKVLGHPSSPNLGNIGKNNWEKITSEHTDYRKYTYLPWFFLVIFFSLLKWKWEFNLMTEGKLHYFKAEACFLTLFNERCLFLPFIVRHTNITTLSVGGSWRSRGPRAW